MVELRFEWSGRIGAPATNSGVRILRNRRRLDSARRGDGDRRASAEDYEPSDDTDYISVDRVGYYVRL